MICKVCGNQAQNREHIMREMMFGFRDEFAYLECGSCGCIHIQEIPGNLEKYYPKQYYSLNDKVDVRGTSVRLFLNRLTTRLHLLGINILSGTRFPYWLKMSGVKINSRILDVGCGTGELLQKLKMLGFPNLSGIDAYLQQDVTDNFGVKILKKPVDLLEGCYDLIMMHHSFEHFDDPRSVLNILSKSLDRNGTIIMRIPLVPCYAWEQYGTNWIQIDAPRHLFIHSLKSIDLLARVAGLKIEKVVYDSTVFQFWGSEMYQHDLSYQEVKDKKINLFSGKELQELSRFAEKLNSSERGDQACLILKHS